MKMSLLAILMVLISLPVSTEAAPASQEKIHGDRTVQPVTKQVAKPAAKRPLAVSTLRTSGLPCNPSMQ